MVLMHLYVVIFLLGQVIDSVPVTYTDLTACRQSLEEPGSRLELTQWIEREYDLHPEEVTLTCEWHVKAPKLGDRR